MENELKVASPLPPAREISIITAEIKDLCRQAQTMALLYAVEIGRRLEEAKRALPHGAWGDWLKNEVDFSQSTANNFMRLFEEYGNAQISIFGASVDSQTFANLPYSKALLLLAVPSDERKEFAEKVGADELSTRELKAAIAERERAKEDAERERAAKEELEEKLEAANAAAKAADEAQKAAETLKKQLAEAQAEARDEQAKNAVLTEKLKKAEADPKIPKKKLDEIKAAAESEAQKAAEQKLEEIQKKAAEAEAEAIKARLAEKVAKERLEAAEQRLKTASPEVAAFKALFDAVQGQVTRLRSMIDKVREGDAGTADKLAAALHAFGQTL